MDAAGDNAPADAAAGTLAPDAITKLLIDKKVFLNGDVLTSLIEVSLDDYEKETALVSFPADSDGQNELRLLVEDEDGVSREVVVPRLRPGRLSARPPLQLGDLRADVGRGTRVDNDHPGRGGEVGGEMTVRWTG